MKRILALCSIVLLLFSCTGGNPSDVREIRLDEPSISIAVGSEAALGWTVLPETALDRSVGFSSSDVSIASVDDGGVVAGIAPGKCTITIASKANPKVFALCTITVTAAAGGGGGGGGGSAPVIDQTKLDQSLAGGRKITEPIEISKDESVTLKGLIIGNIYSILPEEDASTASSMPMIASSAENPSEGEAESDPEAEQPVLIPAGQGYIFEATATEMKIEASAISIKESGSFQVSNLSAVNGIDDKPVEDSQYFEGDMRVSFKDTDPLYETSSEKVFQKIYRINLSDFKGRDENFDKSKVVILSENRGGGKGSSDYGVILDGELLRNDAIIDLSSEEDILVFQERRYDLSGSNDAARNTLYLVTPREMEVDQSVDLPYDSCVYEITAEGKGTEEYVIEITSPFDPIGAYSFTDFPYARNPQNGMFRKGGLLPVSVTENADGTYTLIVYVGTIKEDLIFNYIYFENERNDDVYGKAILRKCNADENYEIRKIKYSDLDGSREYAFNLPKDQLIVPFVFEDFEKADFANIKIDKTELANFGNSSVRIFQGPKEGISGYSTDSLRNGRPIVEIRNGKYLDHGFVLINEDNLESFTFHFDES